MIATLGQLLNDTVAAGDPPAAQCVARDEGVVHASAHGTDARALFDVASVTKVVATTAALARLIADGALSLDAPVAHALPAFGAAGKADVTVRALLGHRSGLPAWDTFFARYSSREEVLDAVFATPLAHAPGTRVYSDLGFLALGALVEAVGGDRLDRACRALVWEPLGLTSDLGFLARGERHPWAEGRAILPTGRTRPREPAPGQESLYTVPPQTPREVPGEVDDDNAWVMGGVAGHAGVFATADAIARFGRALYEEAEGADRLGIGELLRDELLRRDPADGPPRALGFDVPTGPASSVGPRFGRGPRGAVGHLGFTGASLWIDLDRGLSVALLTNRTLEGRHRTAGIRALRPAVHDRLAE